MKKLQKKIINKVLIIICFYICLMACYGHWCLGKYIVFKGYNNLLFYSHAKYNEHGGLMWKNYFKSDFNLTTMGDYIEITDDEGKYYYIRLDKIPEYIAKQNRVGDI